MFVSFRGRELVGRGCKFCFGINWLIVNWVSFLAHDLRRVLLIKDDYIYEKDILQRFVILYSYFSFYFSYFYIRQ